MSVYQTPMLALAFATFIVALLTFISSSVHNNQLLFTFNYRSNNGIIK
jgi:hypothetical protein